MIVYKLMRLGKDGKLYPLFIHRNVETKMNIWIPAECYPTKGFAIRKGWHCCFKPIAPHLKEELKSGEKRVWVECEVQEYETYKRSEKYGGNWILASLLKVIRALSKEEVRILSC